MPTLKLVRYAPQSGRRHKPRSGGASFLSAAPHCRPQFPASAKTRIFSGWGQRGKGARAHGRPVGGSRSGGAFSLVLAAFNLFFLKFGGTPKGVPNRPIRASEKMPEAA